MVRPVHIFSLALLAGVAAMPAWGDDRADVLAANLAFEEAVSRREISALEALSAQDDTVMLIPPAGKIPLVGWQAVRGSWVDGAFTRFSELTVTMPNPSVRVNGTTAIVVGIENVRTKRASDGNVSEYSALTTNVFEKQGGRWLMVHHHASRVPQ